jgi:hypothetical protein
LVNVTLIFCRALSMDAAGVGGHVGDAAQHGVRRRPSRPKKFLRYGHELVLAAEASARAVRTLVGVPIARTGARRGSRRRREGRRGGIDTIDTIDTSPMTTPEDMGAVKSPRDSTPRCASARGVPATGAA